MSVSPNQSGRRSLDHKEPRASLRSSLSWAVRPLWGLSESAWNGPRRFRSVQPPAALRLAGSNRDETSPRGLLDESHLTGQQNSLDTNVIGRKPAPEAKFQISRTAGCTALAGPNRDETSVRGLRRIAVEAPGDWRPPNPSPMNPVLGGTQSFASAAENRQVPTHFPGTSIARKPARG